MQMERLIWQQQKVENKTQHRTCKTNQEVVQQNTTTTLQMWELWRSACCKCILALSGRCSLCFTFNGQKTKNQKPAYTFFSATCIPQWMDGRGWVWTKAQLQVIAAHYQKAALIQNSGDWWKKALKGANLLLLVRRGNLWQELLRQRQ